MAIITKNSGVANKVPNATDLQVGELAVNTADAKLYTKNANGEVVKDVQIRVVSLSNHKLNS